MTCLFALFLVFSKQTFSVFLFNKFLTCKAQCVGHLLVYPLKLPLQTGHFRFARPSTVTPVGSRRLIEQRWVRKKPLNLSPNSGINIVSVVLNPSARRTLEVHFCLMC